MSASMNRKFVKEGVNSKLHWYVLVNIASSRSFYLLFTYLFISIITVGTCILQKEPPSSIQYTLTCKCTSTTDKFPWRGRQWWCCPTFYFDENVLLFYTYGLLVQQQYHLTYRWERRKMNTQSSSSWHETTVIILYRNAALHNEENCCRL